MLTRFHGKSSSQSKNAFPPAMDQKVSISDELEVACLQVFRKHKSAVSLLHRFLARISMQSCMYNCPATPESLKGFENEPFDSSKAGMCLFTLCIYHTCSFTRALPMNRSCYVVEGSCYSHRSCSVHFILFDCRVQELGFLLAHQKAGTQSFSLNAAPEIPLEHWQLAPSRPFSCLQGRLMGNAC